MPSLWFVVPVHGRLDLASICLRQLRRTCDMLELADVRASAVVIADEQHLARLPDLGFATVERDNRFLSRKFNDGIQLACDPEYNPRPADYVVPCGSDDWVDHRLILDNLPVADRRLVGFQNMAFVREDGREMSYVHLQNRAGGGIRIYPRRVMARAEYRPADEDRPRGCDTSILTNLMKRHGGSLRIIHAPSDPRQIVDWKSRTAQLNTYGQIAGRHRVVEAVDPFAELAGIYPAEALDEMRAHYGVREEVVV